MLYDCLSMGNCITVGLSPIFFLHSLRVCLCSRLNQMTASPALQTIVSVFTHTAVGCLSNIRNLSVIRKLEPKSKWPDVLSRWPLWSYLLVCLWLFVVHRVSKRCPSAQLYKTYEEGVSSSVMFFRFPWTKMKLLNLELRTAAMINGWVVNCQINPQLFW